MAYWAQTESGWAVNLDGTDAARRFTLPRLELRSSPSGWCCACHLDDGTLRTVPLAGRVGVRAAMRAGVEAGLRAIGERYGAELRALLASP